MSNGTKSTVVGPPKPVNVFYVWYSELCRRLNSSPAPVVKPAKTKCETVLDFVGDRLKLEEWNPVIKALRQDTSLHVITIRSRLGNCQFLHDIDTEEKARKMKRRYGTLWTAYILKSLLKSLSYSIKNNQVLTCLELDGLPMFNQYLEPLLQALKKNKTIKSLSLTHCPIRDIGCQMVCGYLHFTPNVEVVNLSSCLLTAESGEHLARLIKYQQINRYCESWHNSLRYEEPNVGLMRGIKRITLNGNHNFGDQGLDYILNELEDDLWIKALDFQKCGITENILEKILDVVEYNQSLEIIDFRHNEQISLESLDKIFTVLKQKQEFGYQPEFKWCSTMLTLPCTSIQGTISSYSVVTNTLQKSKSAPVKNIMSTKPSNSIINRNIRKTKTEQFPKKTSNIQQQNKYKAADEAKEVVKLNFQLTQEIAKRKEIEKQNEELKKKLNQIQSVTDLQNQLTSKDVNNIISVLENFKPKNGIIVEHDTTLGMNANKRIQITDTNDDHKPLNGFHENFLENGIKNGTKHTITNGYKEGTKNGYKNGSTEKYVKVPNGFNDIREQASQIFENLLLRNKTTDVNSDGEEDNLINFYLRGEKKNGTHDVKEYSTCNGTSGMSSSQVSLLNFIEEIKHKKTTLTINLQDQPPQRKLSITEKDGGT